MEKTCYLILMSSGLDSTAALLKLINNLIENDALENSCLYPVFIWWRTIHTEAIQKEYENCIKILDYVKNKYKANKIKIIPIKKIESPLIFYEEIREEIKRKGNKNYWAHFRNVFFILSSLNYLINYLNLKEIKDFHKIVIVTGFIGTEADENNTFIQNMKKLLNDSIIDNNGIKNSHILDYVKKFEFYCPYVPNEKPISRCLQYLDIKRFECWDILKYTWSCWREGKTPCYECGGCKTRNSKYEGFEKVDQNLKDPFFKFRENK